MNGWCESGDVERRGCDFIGMVGESVYYMLYVVNSTSGLGNTCIVALYKGKGDFNIVILGV